MADLQAYSCDAITGEVIDRIPVSQFTWSRLLSARGEASATVPLDSTFQNTDGSFNKPLMRDLFLHWARLIRLDRDGQTVYMGFIVDRGYVRGGNALTFRLGDLWTLLARRGAWDHNAPNMEKWSQTVVGNLETHASQAIARGRSGPALPAMGFPISISPFVGGPSVTRTYYGYQEEMVGDVIADLLAEGLDIYFRPRALGNGNGDWEMRAGIGWSSGVQHELFVTAQDSLVTKFAEGSNADRVTNNARFAGEGSEQDLLVRSGRNIASPYPLLDRVTDRKNISNAAQLSALAAQDLVTFGQPTFQWDFSVAADSGIDVGDVVNMHFDGDPWIADGWQARRVVKVSGDLSDQVTISVQPTGGA